MHLTNVAVQKTAPDYDLEKVCNSRISNNSYQFMLLHTSICLKCIPFNEFNLLFIFAWC